MNSFFFLLHFHSRGEAGKRWLYERSTRSKDWNPEGAVVGSIGYRVTPIPDFRIMCHPRLGFPYLPLFLSRRPLRLWGVFEARAV